MQIKDFVKKYISSYNHVFLLPAEVESIKRTINTELIQYIQEYFNEYKFVAMETKIISYPRTLKFKTEIENFYNEFCNELEKQKQTAEDISEVRSHASIFAFAKELVYQISRLY